MFFLGTGSEIADSQEALTACVLADLTFRVDFAPGNLRVTEKQLTR